MKGILIATETPVRATSERAYNFMAEGKRNDFGGAS